MIVGDVIILATQALPAWAARNEPPPAGVQPVEIRITAEQFAWNIHYPGPDGVFGRTSQALISASNPIGIDREDPAAKDDIGLLNVLMLPVNRTAVIQLTSRDVIHSFTLERDARETGRESGHDLAGVVHADRDRRLGDRLLAAMRAGPLPHAR